MRKQDRLPAVSPSSRRTMGQAIFLLLLVSALLFVFAPWRNETKAKRVRDNLGPSVAWAVRNGQFIQAKKVGPNLLVTTSPLGGGIEKTLYSLDISKLNVMYATFTDTEFLFATYVTPPRERPFAPSGTGIAVEVSLTFSSRISQMTSIQDFLLSKNPKSDLLGTKRKQKQDDPPYDPRDETMYRVPLNGEPIRTQVFSWNRTRAHFYTEDAAYSVRSTAREYTEVQLPDGKTHNEYPAQTSLYIHPLTGEPEHLLLSKLPSVRALSFQTDSEGVTVRTVRPYPDSAYDLIRISRNGKSHFLIPGYRGYGMPLLHENRLWWLEFGTVLDAPDTLLQKLASCRLDGSDYQTLPISTDADGKDALCLRLEKYREGLYLVYERAEDDKAGTATVETATPPKGVMSSITAAEANGAPGNRVLSRYLARLYPDKEMLFSKPVALPPTSVRFTAAQCDGDYFYYSEVEERTDPLDFLKEQWTMSRVVVLRNFRLPE